MQIVSSGDNWHEMSKPIFWKKILCKLSPQETIGMKCQSLFSGKNKKSICHLLNLP